MAHKIAELLTARAELAAEMEKEAELLASPQLLSDHPELRWERAASQGAVPRLGVAQRLFVQDRRLSDFRCASTVGVDMSRLKILHVALTALQGCKHLMQTGTASMQ